MGEIDFTDQDLDRLKAAGEKGLKLAESGKLGPLEPAPKEYPPAPRTLPRLDDSKIAETP